MHDHNYSLIDIVISYIKLFVSFPVCHIASNIVKVYDHWEVWNNLVPTNLSCGSTFLHMSHYFTGFVSSFLWLDLLVHINHQDSVEVNYNALSLYFG